MDEVELNKSLLSNEELFINFFKLKYNNLPNSFSLFDSNILNTLKLIDNSYVNNLISFEEAISLISKLFSGLLLNNDSIYGNNPINSDLFYSMLLDGKFNNEDLTKLLNDNRISYQLYFDGLNYLSREDIDNNIFIR